MSENTNESPLVPSDTGLCSIWTEEQFFNVATALGKVVETVETCAGYNIEEGQKPLDRESFIQEARDGITLSLLDPDIPEDEKQAVYTIFVAHAGRKITESVNNLLMAALIGPDLVQDSVRERYGREIEPAEILNTAITAREQMDAAFDLAFGIERQNRIDQGLPALRER